MTPEMFVNHIACDPTTVEGSWVRIYDKATGKLLAEAQAPEAQTVEDLLLDVERTFVNYDPLSVTGQALIGISRSIAQRIDHVRREAEALLDRIVLDEEYELE